MDGLILNPHTARQLQTVSHKPPQVLLIIGPAGSGKHTVATRLAAGWLGVEPTSIDNHPFYVIIKPDKTSISIDAVRRLKHFAKLKTVGKNDSVKRVVLIEDAGALTREAQNAILKILEEPPADMILVLTAIGLEGLLPTIVSRTQQLLLKPVAQSALSKHFSGKNYSDSKIASSYHLSDGRPGLMHAILVSDTEHTLYQQVANAKTILTSSSFDRLAKVDELAKQKDQLPLFLEGLHRVVQAAFNQAIAKNEAKNIDRWKVRLRAVNKASSAQKLNANAKLVLSDLFLSL